MTDKRYWVYQLNNGKPYSLRASANSLVQAVKEFENLTHQYSDEFEIWKDGEKRISFSVISEVQNSQYYKDLFGNEGDRGEQGQGNY